MLFVGANKVHPTPQPSSTRCAQSCRPDSLMVVYCCARWYSTFTAPMRSQPRSEPRASTAQCPSGSWAHVTPCRPRRATPTPSDPRTFAYVSVSVSVSVPPPPPYSTSCVLIADLPSLSAGHWHRHRPRKMYPGVDVQLYGNPRHFSDDYLVDQVSTTTTTTTGGGDCDWMLIAATGETRGAVG